MNYYETDPEFMELFEHFAFNEVAGKDGQQLTPQTRYLVILATLIGCQGMNAYREILPKALDAGISPIVVKETIYQSVNYPGMGRMWPFLKTTNEVFSEKGIVLPLPSQTTATRENRLEKGMQACLSYFRPSRIKCELV